MTVLPPLMPVNGFVLGIAAQLQSLFDDRREVLVRADVHQFRDKIPPPW